VETYKQAAWIGSGSATKMAKDTDGYRLVQKALALTGARAMTFALVAMNMDKRYGVQQLREHIAQY
jgi:hypothetical protein